MPLISTAANDSERKAWLALLEAGVTYLTDRGYLAFDIFQQITTRHAVFIMRIRSKINATVQTGLAVPLPESWNLLLSDVTDT